MSKPETWSVGQKITVTCVQTAVITERVFGSQYRGGAGHRTWPVIAGIEITGADWICPSSPVTETAPETRD
jgi:hypothetical protein